MTRDLRADVCIVGCGPAGITLARCLVADGVEVLALESGRLDYDPGAQSLLEGMAEGPVIKDFAGYLRDARRCQVGGAGGSWGEGARPWLMPFDVDDFESRDWIAHGGWPVTAAELAGYAQRAARALRVAPFDTADGRDDLEWTPRLSSCVYHFPARPGVLRTDFLQLCGARNFRVELGCTVLRIVVEDGAVEALSAVAAGEEARIRADRFVLASGGVENSRLLLLAVDRRARAAPLTCQPALGRFFMEHFHVVAGRVRVPVTARWLPYLASGHVDALGHDALRVLQISAGARRRERLLGATAQLAPRMRSGLAGLGVGDVECDLFIRAEQAPNPASRVCLDENHLDEFGRPRVHLYWLPVAQDWCSIVRTADLMLTELRTAFALSGEVLIREDQPWPQQPVSPSQSDRPTWGHHHMGTTRMHGDPDQAVVDPNCRVKGMSNLYAAGSSVFATSSFANPTFMIVALSIRLADHLRSL